MSGDRQKQTEKKADDMAEQMIANAFATVFSSEYGTQVLAHLGEEVDAMHTIEQREMLGGGISDPTQLAYRAGARAMYWRIVAWKNKGKVVYGE